LNEQNYFKTEYHSNCKFPLSIYNIEVNSSSYVTPHYHENFEIIYVHSGKTNIQLGNETFETNGQSIFFANMYQVHSIKSANNEACKANAIVFDKKILEMVNLNDYYLDFIKPFIDGTNRFPAQIPLNTELYNRLSDSLNLIIQEYNKKDIAYEIFIKTELERLFATIIRYHIFGGNIETSNISLSHKELIDSLMNYIKNNFHKKISLDEISKFLNINKYYLCRLIKNITGKSFTELLNMYRISQAEILIKSENISITKVAELSGYSNLSYFNRMFLKYVGRPPSTVTRRTSLEDSME